MTWLRNTADAGRSSQLPEAIPVGVGSSWDWTPAFWQQLGIIQSQASAEENIIKGALSSKLLWTESANNVSLTHLTTKLKTAES